MTDPRTPSPALDLTVLLALATALIYTAGWAYAYHWYGDFNLGIIGLDIPLEYFFMYGFWTARAHWWWMVLVYAIGVALWLFLRERLRPWLWRTAPVWALFLFWLAYGLGGHTARTDYAAHQGNAFACYPLVRLGLKSEDKRTAPLHDLVEQLTERDYRLLLQTKGLLVLIKPKPQTVVPVVVPLSSVDVLRLTPVNPGCRG